MNRENAVKKLSLAARNLQNIVEHLQFNKRNTVSVARVEKIDHEVQELYEEVFDVGTVDNEDERIEIVRTRNNN